jgi:hypothetical protein
MSLRTGLKAFIGDWHGTNRLWVSPDAPIRESETSAKVTLVARETFMMITYTWADHGKPQDGVLIIRLAEEPGALDMVWFDSWHTEGKFMTFRREDYSDKQVSAIGSYAAPEGPDWGWRIVLIAGPENGFLVRMYNIPPAGIEELAVEAKYS